jgi:hypothetical protein
MQSKGMTDESKASPQASSQKTVEFLTKNPDKWQSMQKGFKPQASSFITKRSSDRD